MPIRGFLSGRAFEPEAINTMALAFNDVCDQLGLKSTADDPATKLVAENAAYDDAERLTAWGVGRCSRWGRDERSCNPANPSRRYRSTHLRTLRGQTPAASATASGVCPLSTCRTIRSRPRGVSRAFLCIFIRFSPWNLKLQQPQLPRSQPDGQPNKSSQLAIPPRPHQSAVSARTAPAE